MNHLNLLKGVYVSRMDAVGEHILTTFDIRMKQPNKEPVMQTAEMHTIEHLAATFLRNHKKNMLMMSSILDLWVVAQASM